MSSSIIDEIDNRMLQLFLCIRNELIINHQNIDFSTLNKSISSELFNKIKYLDMGVLPGSMCYLLNLPDDLLQYVIGFINIHEMHVLNSVCKYIKNYLINVIKQMMKYYTVGRVMYFISNQRYIPGIITCDIDIINYETYEHHVGFHVYTMDGNETYYPKNEIMKYSHMHKNHSFRILQQPNYKGRHAPYLNKPHEICSCGKYVSGCRTLIPTTAPSSCIILDPSYIPNLHDNIGKIMDVSTFPRNNYHLQQALKIENTYGVAFRANGVPNINNTINDTVKVPIGRMSDTARRLINESYSSTYSLFNNQSSQEPVIFNNDLPELLSDNDVEDVDTPELLSDNDAENNDDSSGYFIIKGSEFNIQ